MHNEYMIFSHLVIKLLSYSARASRAFTFVELLVVVTIISVIVTASIFSAINISSHAKRVRAENDIESLIQAVLNYQQDMGFYPPDVYPGFDPGLTQPLPNDTHAWGTSGLPSNWQDIVADRWNGPYIERFPTETPWKGFYDYNHWTSNFTLCSATSTPGIYISIISTSNYCTKMALTPEDEQYFLDRDIDSDGELNNVVQVRIQSLD